MDLSQQRSDYSPEPLDIDSLSSCPVEQFEQWYVNAQEAGQIEPNACCLATVSSDGAPTQRTVLLKYFDQSGFVFFTNTNSRKASQIAQNSSVSMLFQWLSLHRQVEISGQAEPVSKSEAIRYFMKRPQGSQIGAWVSDQSAVIESRKFLTDRLAEMKRLFKNRLIPMPSHWGGFRIVPSRIEFWQGGADRLHDRIEYSRYADQWLRQRLAP